MVHKTVVGKSANDDDFRQIVKAEIGSAKTEIVVIAGELGSYLFPELREAAIQAVNRGVHVKIYATHTVPSSVYEEISKIGGEIYLGERQVRDHYLVIDGQDCIISKKEDQGVPTKIGERLAIVYENDPSKSKKAKRLFNELVFLSFLEADKDRSLLSRVTYAVFQLLNPRFGDVVEKIEND